MKYQRLCNLQLLTNTYYLHIFWHETVSFNCRYPFSLSIDNIMDVVMTFRENTFWCPALPNFTPSMKLMFGRNKFDKKDSAQFTDRNMSLVNVVRFSKPSRLTWSWVNVIIEVFVNNFFNICNVIARTPFKSLIWGFFHSLHHCTKKWSFPLRIYLVNVIKSSGNCGFGHIYWRNP